MLSMHQNLPEGFRAPPRAPRRRIDINFVLALTWILVAIGLTVLLGPKLGLRGWVWLGLHHLLCLIGTSHELWRAHRRRSRAREGPG
jgi:hypothetical protein